MTAWFCRECGTALKALHWPEDDYQCPNKNCIFFDVEIDSLLYTEIHVKEYEKDAKV